MESKPIPIKQIAKDLSISSTTVSRALSGKGRVSEDTRNKIIEYGRAGGTACCIQS